MNATTFAACPTDTVEAPVDVVWKLLTDISAWGNFYDIRVTRVEPPGLAAIGQRMLGETGPRWLNLHCAIEYTLIDEANHKLELDIRLPLGIKVHEAMDCVPFENSRCRVNYHCNFTFSDGWRGKLLRLLLSRGLQTGPADSLQRLKRAAEQKFRDGKGQIEKS